ncbi:MAG TPA: 50S ribosomal protein L23 [bacterium]|jgi:large subunit ribosomal protein L23|nr:50S ribosomal protein L23 [bacterium]
MRLSKSIIKPIITEKSYDHAAYGKYVFEVSINATKGSIKNEIKNLYGVDVVEVKTSIMPGKSSRIGRSRMFSVPSKWKKAVVKLKEGQSIDLFPKDK